MRRGEYLFIYLFEFDLSCFSELDTIYSEKCLKIRLDTKILSMQDSMWTIRMCISVQCHVASSLD